MVFPIWWASESKTHKRRPENKQWFPIRAWAWPHEKQKAMRQRDLAQNREPHHGCKISGKPSAREWKCNSVEGVWYFSNCFICLDIFQTIHFIVGYGVNTGWGKRQVYSCEYAKYRVYSCTLFIHSCVILHMNNSSYKPVNLLLPLPIFYLQSIYFLFLIWFQAKRNHTSVSKGSYYMPQLAWVKQNT